MAFFQTIWVFEQHPELSDILEQVEDPTDYNLRAVGLVKVRVLDALQRKESGWLSWSYYGFPLDCFHFYVVVQFSLSMYKKCTSVFNINKFHKWI